MTRKVRQSPMYTGLMAFTGWVWLFAANAATGQTAEEFYASDVDSIVQGKCISCHRSGGQAASGGADLLFTSSAGSNHQAFDTYVNTPTTGAKASRVLSKITGGSGHGGGQVISQGSADAAGRAPQRKEQWTNPIHPDECGRDGGQHDSKKQAVHSSEVVSDERCWNGNPKTAQHREDRRAGGPIDGVEG